MYKKILFITIVCLCLIPLVSAKYDNTYFNNYWYKFYKPNIEFGGCGEIRVTIINDTITNYKWHLANMYIYGNESYVYTRCNHMYDTLVHSHPVNSACVFSDVDYNSMKIFKYSVLYCANKQMRIAYRDYYGHITEGLFNIDDKSYFTSTMLIGELNGVIGYTRLPEMSW